MESDLSLLEMSMEDDSLLQNDDVSGLNNTFFACSPLEIPRSKPPASRSILSPMEGVKGNEDAARPSSSSHSDSANKENIFMNKLEVSKLTLEPQQMKRKKKVGGYNLRKSLAWDRAFFTEEGVLNSFELSIISGELNKSSGAMLPIIHEDGSESLSGNVDCSSHSQGLQALEETLFQEFPKHASPSRNNTTPASAAKRKVLAAHDLNRSGSKRNGCPRPVASSSLKRPVNVIIAKTANKGSKVSKIPVSKAGPCATSKTSAMQGANQSKRNQIAQLGVDAQKNIGVKSPSNNHKSALKKSNSGEVCQPLAKSYAQQARRYVHSVITQTNHGVKMKPGQVLPAPPHGQNGHKNGTSKIAVTPPQTDSSVCGNMRTAQLQTSKPSGLRMPSPSLGFFGQSKVSDLHGLLPTSTPQSNQSNFSVPDARKPGAPNPVHVKPPLAPGKLPKVLNDGTRSGKRRVAGTGMGCSISSTFNYSSDEKMKSDLHVMNMQKVEVKLPHSPNSCEVINNEQMLPSVCNDFGPQSSEHAETCNDEKIHHVDDQELQNNDKKLLLQSECREHLKKSDDERSANVCPESIDLIGSEMENFYVTSHISPITQVESVSRSNDKVEIQHGIFSESKSCDTNSCFTDDTPNMHLNWLSSAHDANEQARLMKPHNCEDGFSAVKSPGPCMNNGTLSKEIDCSDEFRNDTSLKIIDVQSEVLPCNATELQKTQGFSHSKDMGQAKDIAFGIDDLKTTSHGNVHLQSFDDNLQAESGKSILSSSVVDNYQPTKFENFCLPAEQVFHDNCELLLNDCLMHGERFSSEDSQQKNVPLNSNSVVPKKTDACGSELASSSALCLLPPANQDCGSDVAVMAECLHMMDALSGSVDDKNLQGNALQSFKSIIPEKIDACFIIPAKQGCGSDRDEIVKCLHVKDTLTGSADIEERVEKFNYAVDTYDTQYSQATSLESERMGKEQLLSPAVQVNGGSGLSDRIEHNDVEEKPYDSHCSIFVIQSEHDISYRKLGASDVDSDRLSVAHVVNKESIEHVKLITSRSLEADKPSREEEWSPKVYYDPLFEERSGKFNVGNIVDACPEAKCSCASEHELAEVANEVAAANTSFMEDAKMQSLDRRLVVDNCNLNTSLTNDTTIGENEQVREDANMQYIDGSLLDDSCSFNTSVEKDMFSVVVTDDFEQLVEDENVKSLDGSILVGSCSFNTSVANGKSSMVVNDENEQFMEEANMQCLDDSLLVDSCNINTSVANDKSPFIVNDENEPPGEHLEFQNPSLVEKVSFDNQKSGLEEEFSLTSYISSEDSRDHNFLGSFEVAPGMKDGGRDVDDKMAYLPVEDSISGSVESEQHSDMKGRHDDEPGNQATSSEFNSSSMIKDKTSGAVSTGICQAVGCSNKESGLIVNQTSSSGSALESHVMKSVILSEEAETDISRNGGSTNSEMQHASAKQMDATVLLKKSDNDKKQKTLLMEPPPHAVPFSEEWLAALEAAGEEILTRKSGAVQHSPPDKSLPEPSPWSPVKKKKNQGIGPYDCTKFTNTNILPSSSS